MKHYIVKKAPLVIPLEKAIFTKPSAELAGAKAAKKPAKASAKYTDEKGRQRYKYKGQKPDVGGKAKKASAPAADKPPADPPAIDTAELAVALRVTEGALQKYASRFRTAAEFAAYAGHHAKAFLKKHNVGQDKLRRLYDSLTAKAGHP